MSKKPHTVPRFTIIAFMVIGLVSAISFRTLTIVHALRPEWMRGIWYFGVIGYILFFAYRYYISIKRKRAIAENRLQEKVTNGALSDDDRELINYVLASIMKSKENINYLFIFAMSIIAIVVDIFLNLQG